MKNKQKGLANTLLMLLVIVIVGVIAYFVLVKKSPETAQQTTISNSVTQNKDVFVNIAHGLEFTIPSGYFVRSGDYDVTDATKAERLFFRKESSDYSEVPVLTLSTNLKLSSGQTSQQLAQSVFSMNKDKNYVTTNLKDGNYGDTVAYEFGLQSGYVSPNGGRLLDSSGGKVIFLYQNGKVFELLQTGSDSGLTSILNSLKFK